MPASTTSDLDALTALNDLYIRCVVQRDAATFDTILAADFLCSNSDGTLVDKPAFLRQTTAARRLTSMEVRDVRIRVLGDTAIIHGETQYRFADGSPGRGRYTDVWSRRDGGWVAVSAHVTRIDS
jgi:ketosteroid isomerase-like protein